MTEHVIFLHGAGNSASSWDPQLAALPEGFEGTAPEILGTRTGEPWFDLTAACEAVADLIRQTPGGRAHLCGLSLGGIMATRIAAEHPDLVTSLTVSGGQIRPPRATMLVQRAIFTLIPAGLLGGKESKKRLLGIFRTVGAIDMTDLLGRITAPTLVMCGSRDKPNLRAAHDLAAGIAGASLQIVPDVGHVWNESHPSEFSARLAAFLQAQRG